MVRCHRRFNGIVMNYRHFIFLFTLLIICTHIRAQKVRLWEGTKVSANSVTLEIFLPDTASSSRPAVIVCPGGSYCWHDYDTEGTAVAKWLNSKGIAAFVLNYRVQGIFQYVTHIRLGNRKHPKMLQDVQRALQYVRMHADSLHVNPNMVGIMGFSAGGHLAMAAAEYFNTDFCAPLGLPSTVSLRPDFVAPIYPVVTMREAVTHKRSRRALLGEWGKYSREMRDSLSLERHVPADCPPVFLVNCKDDPVVEYQNSELLDSALTEKNIPHTYIQYQTGGHGFGASDEKGTQECRQWREAFLQFINKLK